MHIALILVFLALRPCICSAPDGKVVFPSSLSKCFNTPCLALVLIETRADFMEKRMRMRSTWLRPYEQPDLAFVFVLGLLSKPNDLQAKYQEWESKEFGDMKTLNVSEDDVHVLDRKAHAMFSWGFELGIDGKMTEAAPRWSYLIKTDDDTVINTFQLRLFLLSPVMSPRKKRIYWGRSLTKKGWPTRMHLGMLYLISMDIAEAFHSMTYEQFESGLDPKWTLEDLRIAFFVSSIVPQEEWIDSLHCELHDFAPNPSVQRTEFEYAISNQTIVVHRVKSQEDFMAAFSTFLPIIEGMKADCSDIDDPKCQRWHISKKLGCYVAPGLDLTPKDAPLSVHVRHSILSLVAVCGLSASFMGGLIWLKNKYAEEPRSTRD